MFNTSLNIPKGDQQSTYGFPDGSTGNNVGQLSGTKEDGLPHQEFQTLGTVLMAVEYDGGVVIAADTRTSAGSYVTNRGSQKITQLTNKICCLTSGVASHSEAITDIVKYHMDFYSMTRDREPTVKATASTVRNLCYRYRGSLQCGLIVAGWDAVAGGQVYSIPIGGMLERRAAVAGGSGSIFLQGHIDLAFRPDFTRDEAYDFVSKCITAAIARDTSCGGMVRLAVVNKDGIERSMIRGDALPVLYQG